MPDNSEWIDDYCAMWQYDNDLINQANDELATIINKEDRP